MTTIKPNLFEFATSELSQDAFICWLLSWADPIHKNTDKDLHRCGQNLIKAFFQKHEKSMPEIKTVIVKKQYKNIDVLCIINNKYPIIIEDKTGTQNHSDQLKKYFEEIKDEGYKDGKEIAIKFKKENILPIYYKTEDQACYKDIEENNGYKAFRRDEILKVLNGYEGENAILIDYKTHLQSISNLVAEYKTKAQKNWKWHQWIGFYIELEKPLKGGSWGYVPNQSGGFLAFWWEPEKNSSCCYLQLEQKKLCFKIKVDDKEKRREGRWKQHVAIMKKAKEYNLEGIKKPKRFGSGTHMTVCIWENYIVTKNGTEILDIDKTIQNIEIAKKILISISE